MPRKSPSTQQVEVSPNIIRAWFDTALNPLIYGLNTEAAVLADRNLTWRYELRLLASLVPVKSHLLAEAWDNLEQFLSLHPECCAPIAAHDAKLQGLFDACKTLHGNLRHSSALQTLYGRVTSPGLEVTSIFGAYPPEEYLDVLAEYIINDVQRLPSYYSTATFWNGHAAEFLSVRDDEEIRPYWEATVRARIQFVKAVNHLLNVLKKVRNELSLSAGVPIVERSSY
jgi:hypothetical protein